MRAWWALLGALLGGMGCEGGTAEPGAPEPGTPPATPAATPATPPASPGGAPASTPAPAEPKVNTLLGTADGITFIGNWTSPECGGRKYPRNIRFEGDNTYAGIDLLNPCPAGTPCVWSGMVGFSGLWMMGEKKVVLQEAGSAGGPGSPHPTEFTADMEGNLIAQGCAYTRGLYIPPGYNEDQVTPRPPKPPVVAP